jgi:protocatechuate 3,4-dioxygenase, alpha subunit
LSDNTDLTPTPAQTAGPYFHLGCIAIHSVRCIAGPDAKGERIRLICRVLDGDGVPVDDAMIEVWQADGAGRYNHPADSRSRQSDRACQGFGRLATDADGVCIFDTIKPGRVPIGCEALQAPHFSVSVFARGILKRLATRIYFLDDPANAGDPVLAAVPEQRRYTLMARSDSRNPDFRNSDGPNSGDWHFDVRLCGKDETVFFDV